MIDSRPMSIYQCPYCNHKWQKIWSITDEERTEVKCPNCLRVIDLREGMEDEPQPKSDLAETLEIQHQILGLLALSPMYPYDLAKVLNLKPSHLSTALLNLRKERRVNARWVQSDTAKPPRRLYSLNQDD